MKPLNSLTKFYIKLSNFGKVLFFTDGPFNYGRVF